MKQEFTDRKKMQKNALATFLTGSAIVYGGAIIYTFARWSTEVAYLLIGAVGLIALIVRFIFRSK